MYTYVEVIRLEFPLMLRMKKGQKFKWCVSVCICGLFGLVLFMQKLKFLEFVNLTVFFTMLDDDKVYLFFCNTKYSFILKKSWLCWLINGLFACSISPTLLLKVKQICVLHENVEKFNWK